MLFRSTIHRFHTITSVRLSEQTARYIMPHRADGLVNRYRSFLVFKDEDGWAITLCCRRWEGENRTTAVYHDIGNRNNGTFADCFSSLGEALKAIDRRHDRGRVINLDDVAR